MDKSGDFVDQIEEIEKTAVRFMLSSRNTDVGHANVKTGSIVESMVFTPEKIEKMGIPAGVVPSGWWIGTKVDDATWADYKAGRLTAFSVHGKGLRLRRMSSPCSTGSPPGPSSLRTMDWSATSPI